MRGMSDHVDVDVGPHVNLTMQGDLTADYCHSGTLFDWLTLWDFVSRVQKVLKAKPSLVDEDDSSSDQNLDVAGDALT